MASSAPKKKKSPTSTVKTPKQPPPSRTLTSSFMKYLGSEKEELSVLQQLQVYHLTTPRQYKSTQTRVDSLAIFKYKIISVSPQNYYCVRDPTDPNTSTGFYTVSTGCVWDVIFKMSSINPYFSPMIVRILNNLVH